MAPVVVFGRRRKRFVFTPEASERGSNPTRRKQRENLWSEDVAHSSSRDPRFVTVRKGGTLDDNTHRLLAVWSADCAARVLDLFEREHPGDTRPRAAVDQTYAWAGGEITTTQARDAAYAAHDAAKGTAGAAREAARAAGHAVATAHMADHGLGGAAYAIRAIRAAALPHGREEAGRAECRWQQAHLPSAIRELVLEDMRLRNTKFWSLFDASMSGDLSIELRPLTGTPRDLLEVQRVLELAPDYAKAVQGGPVDPFDATRTFKDLPPGVDPSAKTVFGIYADDELVGVIDLVDGFPVPTTAMLGLLLLAGTHRRRGIGARAARVVEDLILSWGTCDRVRIGVVRANAQALVFWEAVGYSATGELRPYEEGAVRSEVVVMEKRIG